MAANKQILKSVMIFAIVLLSFPNFSMAQDIKTPTNNAPALFYQANALYEKGDFEGATALYQQIVAEGYESGNLYYNLGNSYFKLGKRGMAILYYEKAKRIIPGDADLKANLSYILNAAGVAEKDWKQALWDSVVNVTSLSNLFILSSFLLFIVALVLIFGILFPVKIRDIKNNRLHPLWFWFLLVSACFLTIAVSLTTLTCIDQNTVQAVVIRSGAARFEPKAEGTVYYSINEGAKVQVLDKKDDWRLVKRQDGKRGWIEDNFLDTI